MKSEPWPEFYYDACEFFYAEPQHFKRGKFPSIPKDQKPLNGFEQFRQTLDGMEVSLNHILNFLFILMHDHLVEQLTQTVFGQSWPDQYTMVGNRFEERYRLPVNATQPDFMFDGQSHILSIEMKIGAKTDANQLAKYLYIHCKAQERNGLGQKHGLIFLGPKSWPQLWKDGQDFSAKRRLEEAVADTPKTVGIKRVPVDQMAIANMAAQMEVGYLSYQSFAQLLKSISEKTTGIGWEAAAGQNLIKGTIAELVRRRLVVAEDLK